mgnify:FL=1
MAFLVKKLGAWGIQLLKDLRAVFIELIRFLFPGVVKQPLIIARSLYKSSTRKQLVQNLIFLLAVYAVSIILMFCKSLWAGSVYTVILRYILPLAALCMLLSTVYNASSSGLRLILLLSIFGVMVQTAISTTTAAELIRHHFFAVGAGLLAAVSYYFLAQLEPRCMVRLLKTLSVFIYTALLFSSARHSAKNWLSIGGGSVQGTEITRLLAVISIARACTMPEKSDRQRTFMVFQTLFLHLGFLVLLNEFSIAIVIFITAILLLLVGVQQLRWSVIGVAATALAGYTTFLTCKLCYQVGGKGIFRGGSLIYRKLIARVHPEQASDSFQLDAARKSLLLSDWFGSNADVYVPASDTDFILVSAIKTFGYSFFFIFIFLMFALLVLALLHAEDCSFPRLLSLGCILTLEIQFLCNAASALSIGPIMGITCPFLSLGGTSLVVTFFFCGVLLAASSSLPPEKPIFFYKRGGKNER